METNCSPPSSYKKSLLGLELTDDLLQLWHGCFLQCAGSSTRTVMQSSSYQSILHLDKEEAIDVMRSTGNPESTKPKFIPIDVLCAMQVLLDDKDKARLETALDGTSLFFTPPPKPPEETVGRRKYRQRIERLRLKSEETKYGKLTSNLQSDWKTDDITAKSMTYAASVGLNMIVAPLSFGCFMYFFAGSLFDYFLGDDFSSRTSGGTDIKRVIVGVISGVVMLFIEMILFVIRTHEFEAYERKKKRSKGPANPFGVYSKSVKSFEPGQRSTKDALSKHD
eukprot:scaffold3827_cov179-Cylindrotheca_fusiformis.AAC.38